VTKLMEVKVKMVAWTRNKSESWAGKK